MSQAETIGLPISALLIASQKEIESILTEAQGDLNVVYKRSFERLKKAKILDVNGVTILTDCFGQITKVRTGAVTPKKALAFIQNKYAKAILDGNQEKLTLALLDLCASLLNGSLEVLNIANRPLSATRSFIASGLEAVLVSALVGAVIGAEYGGFYGAMLGAGIGAVFGACQKEVVVVVNDPGGPGGPT